MRDSAARRPDRVAWLVQARLDQMRDCFDEHQQHGRPSLAALLDCTCCVVGGVEAATVCAIRGWSLRLSNLSRLLNGVATVSHAPAALMCLSA